MTVIVLEPEPDPEPEADPETDPESTPLRDTCLPVDMMVEAGEDGNITEGDEEGDGNIFAARQARKSCQQESQAR